MLKLGKCIVTANGFTLIGRRPTTIFLEKFLRDVVLVAFTFNLVGLRQGNIAQSRLLD